MVPAPEQAAQTKEGRAPLGDGGVSEFGYGREAGQISIQPKPELFARRMRNRQETGFGAAGAPAVGRDILHRALEFGFGNCRILRQDLLIGPILDAFARQLLPIARPIAAEPAVAVIDEPGPRARGWRFDATDGLFSGCLCHDINNAKRSAWFVGAFVGETVGRHPSPCVASRRRNGRRAGQA